MSLVVPVNRLLLEQGIIFLTGEIEEEISKDIVEEIIYLNRVSFSEIDKIALIINSSGGYFYDTISVIDIIKWSNIPVYTTGLGLISSGGLSIFMAGERGHRTITKNTSILSHRFSDSENGNYSDLVAGRKQEDIIHSRMVDFYIQHSNLKTREEVEEKLLKDVDVWLTPKEAIDLGIADKIDEEI